MKHICSLQLFAILSTSSGQISSRVYMNGKEEGIPYATYQVRGGIEVGRLYTGILCTAAPFMVHAR